MDESALTFGEAFTRSEREKDARAAEAIGWKLDYEFEDMLGTPTVPHLRDQYDEWGILPAFGEDANAARTLVLALPPERQDKFARTLYDMLRLSGVGTYDIYAIVTATPRQLRDAVLAAMEEPAP